MLTIEEFMSMTYDEVCAFLERDNRLIREGRVNINQPNIDLKNMSDEEIAQKYNYSSIDTIREKVNKKLKG